MSGQLLIERSPHALRWEPVWAFGAFASGIWLSHEIPAVASSLWFAAACVVSGGALLCRGKGAAIALVVAVVLLGAGQHSLRCLELKPDAVQRLVRPAVGATALIEVEGLARSEPVRIQRQSRPDLPVRPEGWWFELDASRVGRFDASGVLWVFVGDATPPAIRAGDVVVVAGEYQPPEAPLNPGERDWRRVSAVEGGAGTLSLTGPGALRTVRRGSLGLGAVVQALKARANRALGLDHERSPERLLIGALVLGDRGGTEGARVREPFALTGTVHLLAISGLHLMLVAATAVWAFRLGRDRGWIEPLLVAGLVLVYMLVVPARPPILRAGIMTIVLLVSEAMGRRHSRLSVLAWTGIALLAWRPIDAFDTGFRLSLAATAALVWVGPRLRERWRSGRAPEPIQHARGAWSELRQAFVWGPVGAMFASSLICWFAGLGLVAHETGWVALWSVPATMVLWIPVVVILVGGLIAVGVGIFLPSAGVMMAGWLDPVAGLAIWLNNVFVSFPVVGMRVAAPSLFGAIAFGVLACWLMGHRHRLPAYIAGGALIVGLFWSASWRSAAPPLRIDMFAVGDGTSMLIRSERGALLWDCGSLASGAGRFRVAPALSALGVSRLDAVIVSHPNADHYNGIDGLAQRIAIDRVLVTDAYVERVEERPEGGAAYAHSLWVERGLDVGTLTRGDSMTVGAAVFEAIGPFEMPPGAETNDLSLVAAVTLPDLGRTVLLTGDIQRDGIAALRAARPGLRADLIELPHHGSYSAAALSLVRDLDPQIVFQSTGVGRISDRRWTGVRDEHDSWWVSAAHGWCWAEITPEGAVETGSGLGQFPR
ncbi:MAG: ComEC/Rec2 family competence protein [Planctomycetota bacterium]